MPALSLDGWSSPNRAPTLRRTASWLEDVIAPAHEHPFRVRRLARDMRLRAVELEIGTHSESGFDEMVDIVRSSRRMAA